MYKITTFLILLFFTFNTQSKNYFIYSIDHNLPNGEFGTKEEPSKNFYLNIGSLQG